MAALRHFNGTVCCFTLPFVSLWPAALHKSIHAFSCAYSGNIDPAPPPLPQVKQLKTELGVVRSNLTMMSDMMTQLDPVTVKEADMELLEVKETMTR